MLFLVIYGTFYEVFFVRLGTKSRYAVAAMVDMASCKSESPIALSDLAVRQSLPLSYLEQLFSKLRKASLVKSFRGNNGGYTLSRDPSDIYIIDIIYAVDEKMKSTACSVDDKYGCRGGYGKCQTHFLWDSLDKKISDYLSRTSLYDVIYGDLGCSL
jgi:Rrf2 family iron-sulfur cluster assembly transcriptional regulator